jgi:hypothetical protein
MIRIKDIQRSLQGLVGFRNEWGDNALSDMMCESESGLYFQDEHPMLTLSNLRNTAPLELNTIVQEWRADHEYSKGEIVKYSDELKYIAQRNTTEEPTINDWENIGDFDVYLHNKVNASISKVVTRWMEEKKTELSTKTLLDNRYLFSNAGRIADTIEKKGRIVGIELQAPRYASVSTKISKIGLQMKGKGKTKLYLFHSSNPNPIKTIEVERTQDGMMQWFAMDDIILPYVSEMNDAGGVWYIVYWEDDLCEMQAIKKDYDFAKQPCSTCNQYEYNNYEAWSKYLGVSPFYAMPSDKESRTLWDIEDNIYTNACNYGMNLQVSVECDLTGFVIEQKKIFANAISKQFALDMLSTMYYNGNERINFTAQNGNFEKIAFDIEGDSQSRYKGGIRHELDKAIQALKIETNGIDKICMQCRKRGIRVGAI